MRRLELPLAICVLALFSGMASGQSPKYEGMIKPENVTLGMTLAALKEARPQVRPSPAGVASRNASVVVLSEIERGTVLHGFAYHFLDGQLRAVAWNVSKVSMDQTGGGKERAEAMTKGVHDQIADDLTKNPAEKIVLANAKLEAVTVDAELRKDNRTGMCVYYVDAENYTIAVLFDPKYLGKKDFFVDPKDASELESLLAKGRKDMERRNKAAAGQESPATVIISTGQSSLTTGTFSPPRPAKR